MNRTILITGATAGIGEATALFLANSDTTLIITGRRKDRLTVIQKKLEQKGAKVICLHFDITKQAEVQKHLESLENIDVLINNAGLAAGLAPLHQGEIIDWERMIDTNIKGLLYVSRIISEKMVKRGSGHIVNVGSVAGREVYPNGNVYIATKHAVDSLTRAMRLELFDKGIKVSSVSPGLVETEFSLVRFQGDKEKAAQVYNGIEALTGDDIANAIAYIVNAPKHVNIADILILPSAQGSTRDMKRRI